MHHDLNMDAPPNIKVLIKDKKGTKNLRSIWKCEVNQILPAGQVKWTAELGLYDWKYLYYLPHSCKMNARITYFQFQILHRSLVTNKKLKQFGIRDNDTCDFCGEVESHIYSIIAQNTVLFGRMFQDGYKILPISVSTLILDE